MIKKQLLALGECVGGFPSSYEDGYHIPDSYESSYGVASHVASGAGWFVY